MKFFYIVLINVLLIGCGGSGGSSSSSDEADSSDSNNPLPVDTIAPTVTIVFPSEHSLTDQQSITVRGTAEDDQSNISSVRVNGIAATTSDNYENWQVLVPLDTGINTLIVEATDSAANTDANAAQIIVDQGPYLWSPNDMALDKANNRLLILEEHALEPGSTAITAIDLSTKQRSILSNNDIPNSDNPLGRPTAITMDIANGRALVIDEFDDSVIAVDLVTGARSVLSSDHIPNTLAPYLDFPVGIAIDRINNRALVADDDRVITVDLSTGSRAILSDATIPNADDPFQGLEDIAVDRDNNRALVIDSNGDAIKAVNLTTGEREVISNDSIPNNNNPLGNSGSINVDRLNGRALVLDSSKDSVFGIDLVDGERTILAENTQTNEFLKYPISIVTDPTIQTSYILNDYDYSVISVDLSLGELDSTMTPNIPDTQNVFIRPISMVNSDSTNQLFVADDTLEAIVSINKKTGARTVLSDISTPNADNPLSYNMIQIVLDQSNQRLLTLSDNSLISVDIMSGKRTIVSDNTSPTVDLPFNDAVSIALDSSQNRALILDDKSSNEKIFAVDLNSGGRSVVADLSALVNSMGGVELDRIVFDSINKQILITLNDLSFTAGYIISVDLVSGDQKVLSDDQTPNTDNPLSDIADIEIDYENNRLLVVESGDTHIMAVDLISGKREVVSEESVRSYAFTGGIAYESTTNLAYLMIRHIGLMLIDLSSGERVVFSK